MVMNGHSIVVTSHELSRRAADQRQAVRAILRIPPFSDPAFVPAVTALE
jgi:hypothetical protein